ncbi:SGNH/GDSL hydrolase family protein [Georgenia soli]|uniref:SGNH/GDSL hydrolase family protein n=1 Tax=Georgenia soli TaxID=638953 RepID=UPI0014760D2B|nr:SGNH/GDSL hydrolase family protein [Georgenia soli]
MRLPVGAPAGPPDGVVPGAAPVLRLVVLGESTAAGTGAPTYETGMAGHLARQLAADGRQVAWRSLGRNGARARVVTRDLVPRMNDGGAPSHVVVLIGINDLQRSWRGAWARDVADLLRVVQRTSPDARVVVSGLPDVTAIPALPPPLGPVLARRARRFGWATERAAAASGAVYVPVDHLALNPADFSADGLHPGPDGYARWARHLAPYLTR